MKLKITYNELNNDQKSIYDTLMAKIPDRASFSSFYRMGLDLVEERVDGVAGAGKTTLVGIMVLDLLKRGYRVFMASPTHKAAQELNKSFGNASEGLFGLSPSFIGTIHSALGLKLKNHYDKQVLVNDGFVKTGDKDGAKCDILFLDESSMVSEELIRHLHQRQQIDKFHIIYIGDMYQLDPVEQQEESCKRSPVFDIGEGIYNLNNVTRQAEGSPIIQLSALCRDNIDYHLGVKDRPIAKFVDFIDNKIIHKIDHDQMIDNYMSLIKNQPELALINRILSFTNKKVDEINDDVRSRIFGANAREYEAGEIVVMQDSYESYHNSQEIMITSIRNGTVKIHAPSKFQNATPITYETATFNVYTLETESLCGKFKERINVLSYQERKKFDNFMSYYAKVYSSLKKDNRYASKAGWNWFWETKELFPNIKPIFASTIHKSQGSTYKNSILDMSGIKSQMQLNPVNAWKLTYVGSTRPSEQLYLSI